MSKGQRGRLPLKLVVAAATQVSVLALAVFTGWIPPNAVLTGFAAIALTATTVWILIRSGPSPKTSMTTRVLVALQLLFLAALVLMEFTEFVGLRYGAGGPPYPYQDSVRRVGLILVAVAMQAFVLHCVASRYFTSQERSFVWHRRFAVLGLLSASVVAGYSFLGQPASLYFPIAALPLGIFCFIVASALLIASVRRVVGTEMQGYCPACGYQLVGLRTEAACPECGYGPGAATGPATSSVRADS